VCVNVGTAPNVPPLYVKLPDETAKLLEGFIVPLVKLNVAPSTTNRALVTVSANVVVPATNVTL